MHKSLINQEFVNTVHALRRILPKLSFGLVIATYLISALIMGIFHAQNVQNISFQVAAFLVPLAIQTGRGTLVFFFQLNPARIQGRLSMAIIAATALLALSLGEAWLVMSPYGMPWAISVSTLMVIGWIVEVMILKEIQFATQMELYRDKDRWQELQEFYIARANLEHFIRNLKAGQVPDTGNEPVREKPALDAPHEQSKAEGQGGAQKTETQNPERLGKFNRPRLNGRINH